MIGKLWRGETGLTLLEVVLSMAVLGIASLSFINFFGSTFGASMQAGRISQASVMAQETMEVLRVNTYGELLQLGAELSGGIFPCPTATVSSKTMFINGFDGLQCNYSITCDVLEFDGYTIQGLRLDAAVRQREGRLVARITSFVPKDL